MLTLAVFLSQQSFLLQKAGVDSPRLCAEVLTASVLGLERTELLKKLILTPHYSLPENLAIEIQKLIEIRSTGEPLAYILGKKEFFGRDFMVCKHTLIPRPETELLIEQALLCAKTSGIPAKNRKFLDIGTGSGCIAISLALELSTWQGVALDKSREALKVAKINAATHVADVLFLEADLGTSIVQPSSLGLVVSNPPYVSWQEYQSLDAEVKNFEPKSALVPTPFNSQNSEHNLTGLEHIEKIIELAKNYLCSGGFLLIEIGYMQGKKTLEFCQTSHWQQASIIKDLAEHDRLLVARLC